MNRHIVRSNKTHVWVGVFPYQCKGFTYELFLGLVGGIECVDAGDSMSPIWAYLTIPDANAFRDICIENKWEIYCQ